VKFSVIIPVYNRPDEVEELLESLTRQAYNDFEVIVVEDGSQYTCGEVCNRFADRLNILYFFKSNSGPGESRNYGAAQARGEWLIILDSDVIVPEGYLKAVEEGINAHPDLKAFGGPDASHPDFNAMQKAVSYSMTSFFTTGGIRGGKTKMDKFFPRSFNMGVRKDIYMMLGGFSLMRYGEDIDFSYRIVEGGYATALLSEAWVWHKRRTDLRAFFRQVEHSGAARIVLSKLHPGTLKLVHTLPAIFTIGVIALILISAVGRILMEYDHSVPPAEAIKKWYWLCAAPWIPIILYSLLVCIDSTIKNKSLKVGILSIATSFTQLMGYGTGFIKTWLGK